MKIKKLTDKEIDGAKAFELHQKISNQEQMRRALFLSNVQAIEELYDTQGYKAILGYDPTPTWEAYLSQTEVFYSRAQIERWRKIYQKLVKEYGIDLIDYLEVPETRMEDISRLSLNKLDADELLHKAKVLTPQGWKDEISVRTGKANSLDCPHSKTKVYIQCVKCGVKHEQDIGDKHESSDFKI